MDRETVEQAAAIREAANRTRKDAKIPRYPPIPKVKTLLEVRATPEEQEERMAGFRKIVAEKQLQPVRWIDREGKQRSMTVDLMSASVVCQVYDVLHDDRKGMMCALEPIKMIQFAFILGRK